MQWDQSFPVLPAHQRGHSLGGIATAKGEKISAAITTENGAASLRSTEFLSQVIATSHHCTTDLHPCPRITIAVGRRNSLVVRRVTDCPTTAEERQVDLSQKSPQKGISKTVISDISATFDT